MPAALFMVPSFRLIRRRSGGTLRTYASQLGLSQTEQELQASLEEAKQADQQYTQLAGRMMGGNGSGGDRGQEDARQALTGALAE